MNNTATLPVTATMSREQPFLEPLAFALLEDIRAFFQDPENEAEYQAWLANREG